MYDRSWFAAPATAGALGRRAYHAALGLLFCLAVTAYAQTPEERAVEAIRREVTAPSDDVAGYPLPVVSGWSGARSALSFSPDFQIDQVRHGQYLLPWFDLWEVPKLNAGDDYPSPKDPAYYEPGVAYVAAHRLPLCIPSVEWQLLMDRVSPEYAQHGGSVDHKIPLSPFDATPPWYALGREWARHPTVRRLQKLYPDPPLVLLVQDDEYPRVSPDDLHIRNDAHADAALTARRRAMGDAWVQKYRALLQGFRDGLESPAWREHTIIVGFEQFLDSAMGRWHDWDTNSLYVPGRSEPWPYAWDGASVSYALHDYAPDTDFTVWGPQIEAMNRVGELAAVRRAKPNYWFEITTWDGSDIKAPGDKRDAKVRFLSAQGRPFTPSRYGGMVQFGMWLLRPRVVREFRGEDDDRVRFGPYFNALLAAVARVHENPVLREFWRKGRLLPNPQAQHPYESNLPPELAARQRWFLLDSPLNPPRPWELTTALRIFSLALERGQKPQREWLVYAESPLDDFPDAEVTIPGGPRVHVHSTPGGAFSRVSENGVVRTIAQ